MANIKDLIKSIEAADSSFDEKLAAINQMEQTLVAMRQQEEQAVQDNVDLIVEAIKVMERKVENQLEVAKSIVPEKGDKGDAGQRGLDGKNGVDGKDGRDGVNGRDGQDGQDGVSVSDAKIDFDGSLIITLSTGQEINVGEVVAPELQEKIKLVTSGGAGTVLPDQTGNSGKVLGTDGTNLSWVAGGGGGGGSGTVTSVAASAGTGISVTGSPITTFGTLTITNTAPDQTVVLTPSTGISISGAYPSFTIGNSAPDQTVALTGAGTTAITGTYPNFTVTSNDAYTGTVTSVGGTGTVSGLTLSGTVTGSGNLTLGGAITGFATSGANTNLTSVALTSGTITTAPTNNTDIVNKQYADAIASGIHFHEAVALATTAALPANTYNNGTSGVGATLTGNSNGALSVDSTLTIVAERILVKNEVAGANNGVYIVTQVGTAGTPYILTRATDFNTVGTGVNQIDEGDFFLVTSGTANVNTAWVQQTAPPITVGTTALVFQQFSAPITYTAGTGLSESPSYTFNIANIGTAGTYGSASSVPVFVTNAQGQVTSVTNTTISIAGSAITGTVAITNGGTGQTTQTAAFDALSPTTTKGDLIVHNGTDNIRIPVGADTYVLTADSAEPSGLIWAAGGGGGGGGGLTQAQALRLVSLRL
jgi:hypothetical protein